MLSGLKSSVGNSKTRVKFWLEKKSSSRNGGSFAARIFGRARLAARKARDFIFKLEPSFSLEFSSFELGSTYFLLMSF